MKSLAALGLQFGLQLFCMGSLDSGAQRKSGMGKSMCLVQGSLAGLQGRSSPRSRGREFRVVRSYVGTGRDQPGSGFLPPSKEAENRCPAGRGQFQHSCARHETRDPATVVMSAPVTPQGCPEPDTCFCPSRTFSAPRCRASPCRKVATQIATQALLGFSRCAGQKV